MLIKCEFHNVHNVRITRTLNNKFLVKNLRTLNEDQISSWGERSGEKKRTGRLGSPTGEEEEERREWKLLCDTARDNKWVKHEV